MLANGDVFAGYVIDRQLGRGGMGSVYLAKHPRLPRMTALKLLNREMFNDQEVRARFEREADLVARLDHPNIVTVYDRGIEDEQLWISMQYIDGIDAASVEPGKLPPERAVQIISETAAALDYAHGMGVLHRDVKPANILLARSTGGRGERVYLTDFGIARLRDDTGHLTQTGTFTATLAYASPEQLTGSALDHRADQYSLACSLYWLFTGSGPFTATNPAAVIQGHLQTPPPAASVSRAGLSPAVDGVLAKAMAKRPEERFSSCQEFADAAKQALSMPSSPGIPVAGTGAGYPSTPHGSGAHQQYPSGLQTGAPQYPSSTAAPQPFTSAGPQQFPPTQQGQPQQGRPQYATGMQQQPVDLGKQSSGGTGAAPYPQTGGYGGGGSGGYQPPSNYPSAVSPVPPRPRPQKSNTGLIVAIVIGLVVLVGIVIGLVVVAGGGDSGGGGNTTTAQASVAPVPADADSISKEFPQMVPATAEEKVGYNNSTCWQTDTSYTPDPDKGEPDFGSWAHQWRCYGGADNADPFYRFYIYQSADDVQTVVDNLPAGATKQDGTNGGRTYTNYTWEDDGPKMVTVFTGHPERAQYLMFTDGIVGTVDEMVTWWESAPLN